MSETDDPNPSTNENDDGELIDVVTTSFSAVDTSDQDEEEAINPLFAAGAILVGLVASFALLYFELQQAQFLN